MSPIGSVGRSVRGRRLPDAIPDSELTQTADHIWYHNDASGSVLADAIGDKNGDIAGSSWGSGSGTEEVYLDHDGVDDYVDLGDYTHSGSMSAAIWVYPRENDGPHLINLFNEDGGPGGVSAQFLIYAIAGNWRPVIAGDDGGTANNFGSVELDQWQLICLNAEGDTATAYQYSLTDDGLLESHSYVVGDELSVTDDPFYIADRPVSSGRFFDCRTDYMTLEFASNPESAYLDHFDETKSLYQ